MIVATLLIVSSCKKPKPPAYIANVYEQYFETNILNTDFKVKLATNNAVDITNQFTDYRFKLLKNTYYDGPMTATKVSNTSVVYSGTWSCNEDFSKLVISITQSNVPPGFCFFKQAMEIHQEGSTGYGTSPVGYFRA
jgi:hypothetical protein